MRHNFNVGDVVVVKSRDEIDESVVNYSFISEMDCCIGVLAVIEDIFDDSIDGPIIHLTEYASGTWGVFSDKGNSPWMFAPEWLELVVDPGDALKEINVDSLEGLL